jgi:hypothetical protein
MTPFLAYLDTNALDDFFEPRAPVDQTMRGRLLAAVASGRLVIPLSGAVAQEVAAISLTKRGRAVRLARFYLERVASRDHAVGTTTHARRAALAVHLGEPVASPYEPLSRRQRRNMELRLFDKAPGDLDDVVAEYRRDTEAYAARTKQFRDAARALAASHEDTQNPRARKPMPVRESTAKLWATLAPRWAWGLIESEGLADKAIAAGLSPDSILNIPCMRATVGVAVALAATQVLNGRTPQLADYGDFQHVALSACANLALVTHDDALRRLVTAIPDTPLEVLSAEEMLARVPA